MNFTVIDIQTGKYPDLSDIALHEDWAQGLMYCDMNGFAVQEDGTLILMDDCGRFVYCPGGRFQVLDEPNEPLTIEELRQMDGEPIWGKSLINGKPGEWFILRVVEMSKTWFIACAGSEQVFGDKNNYGTTWLAYRRPPEVEGEPNGYERAEEKHENKG